MNYFNDLSRTFGWAANYCQSSKQPQACWDLKTARHPYRSNDRDLLTAYLRPALRHQRCLADRQNDQHQTHRCRQKPDGGPEHGY
jgi:hypothetical protein